MQILYYADNMPALSPGINISHMEDQQRRYYQRVLCKIDT